MLTFQTYSFIDVFPLPFNRGMVHLLDWGKPMNELEVRSWIGQIIDIGGNIVVVKSAKFHITQGVHPRYLLGLLI